MTHHHNESNGSHVHSYLMLGLNLLISAIIMYLVMFTMIDTISDFFNNANMVYMTLMMVAPMAILMLFMMPSMYPIKSANHAIIGMFVVLFVGSFAFIRQQTAIGNLQFVRSMIPHHSGAILMCREAKIDDKELRDLCDQIIKSQRQEITQMKQIFGRM
jgi:hypothetical protein